MLKLTLYSLSVSIGLVSAGYLSDSLAWILRPGSITTTVLTVMILLVPTGDYFLTFPARTSLLMNLVFYTLITFIVLYLWRCLKRIPLR